jgi:serine/threonine-protein kinase HipA
MGRRSHTHTLGLWMNGAFVGTWRLLPHGVETLQYDTGWIASPQGRPLSLSLPFTPDNAPHRGAAVHAWFDNLLPDSRDIRERIARRYGTSVTAFALLAEIGRDCAGALQILPADTHPENTTPIQATRLSDADVARLLRNVVTPAGFGTDETGDFRISIAGAQEKTALLRFEDNWCRPAGATPTSHILKLPLGLVGNLQLDLRDSIENEWLCAQILAAYGIPVARCEPLQFEDMKVLAVERFDRRWSHTGEQVRLLRLPQEDLCQATGTPPHLKYEADGGPGIDRALELLKTSARAEQDVRTFFQAQVLFWMLCAPDGHAKNFSLALRPGGAYALTPLYDVLSAYPVLGEGRGKISPRRVKLAMAVRSKNPHWRMRDILRRHWIAVGERHGVVDARGGDVRAVLDDLIARTPEVLQTVRTGLPEDFPPAIADSILKGLQDAANRLAD